MNIRQLFASDWARIVVPSVLLTCALASTSAFAQTASGNPEADAAGPYSPVALPPGLLAAGAPVGSFYVGDGPAWTDDPPTYTCLETCAMLFGGEADNYECSTQGDSVDNLAWASAWGSGLHCADLGGEPIAEDYKVGTSTDCGSNFCYVSTYVDDWCSRVGSLEASENFCYAIAGNVLVNVTKEFTDGSTDEVEVTLTCNTGLPLEQSFTIAGGDEEGVTFVVRDIPEAGADCEVTETGTPAGYTAVLNGGDGCAWEDVTGGRFTCVITNEADPATYTVVKDWSVYSEGGDVVIAEADVTIECDSMIDGYDWEDDGYWYLSDTLGDGETLVATVDTTEGPATCSASEEITQSGVESSSVGCGPTVLPAGGSATCTFTNTVFFEGIPTLSQYGLAILVLLTLGVGFVGLRRFV